MSETDNQKSEGDLEDILVDDEGGIDLPTGKEEKAEGAASQDTIEAVEALLEDCGDTDEEKESPQSELEKYKDIAARSQADLENYRKRMTRDRTEALQYANFSLLSSLLPVIDNFEMGLKAAKNEGDDSVIYQGMAMVQKQLHDFLTENRVETIEVVEGSDFDPNLHEAIKQEASDTVEEGKIIYAIRNGYRLKERLLRAANVVVSQGPEKKESGEQS